jgi:predicted amidohydrolase YtcJ
MNRTCLLAALALLPIGNRSATAQDQDLALVGGTVSPSPTAASLPDATILIRGKTIVAVGKSNEITIPISARVITCTAKVITAGFWNSHVHFETLGWANADQTTPNSRPVCRKCLRAGASRRSGIWVPICRTRSRFVRGWRAERLAGPLIRMAGAIFPKNGHPVYLPAEMQLIEAATPG